MKLSSESTRLLIRCRQGNSFSEYAHCLELVTAIVNVSKACINAEVIAESRSNNEGISGGRCDLQQQKPWANWWV